MPKTFGTLAALAPEIGSLTPSNDVLLFAAGGGLKDRIHRSSAEVFPAFHRVAVVGQSRRRACMAECFCYHGYRNALGNHQRGGYTAQLVLLGSMRSQSRQSKDWSPEGPAARGLCGLDLCFC